MNAPAGPPVVRLRNGAEVAEPAVRAIMLSLERLRAEHPVALLELRSACRVQGYAMFGNTGAFAGGLGLAEREDGRWQPPGSVRDIVLSAVTGDGTALGLRNPVAS